MIANMVRSSVLFAAVIFAIFVGISQGNSTGFYTLHAPGTIRSNTPYNVVVTTHNAEKPINYKIDIAGQAFNDSKSIEVPPHTTKILTFDIPKIDEVSYDDAYKIKVEGTGGAEFKADSQLQASKKYNSILLQTDKALYKPGDLVRYRVLFLDPNTRPANLKAPVDIQITDGKQNIIKNIKDIKPTKGVYSGEIQLSELPVLGQWKINVDVDGETKTKEFGVEEYVLPKFEVTVDAEKAAYMEDGKIRATVRAKYTYGKPVKGTAEITVSPKYSYQPSTEKSAKKTVPIDGKAPVEFQLEFDRKKDWDKQMNILAVVEEALTGNKQNGSADITVYRDKYEIRGEDIPFTFEPGKPVKIKVKVVYRDGTPVLDSKEPLKISISKGYKESNINETQHNLGSNGEVVTEYVFPEDIEFVSLIGNYAGVESHFGHLRKFTESPVVKPFYPIPDENTPLQTNIKTEKPSIDRDIEVEVLSKDDMDHISYQVIGRGNILSSNIITDLPDKKRHTFTFKPTIEMVPNANVYVQTIKNGELRWSENSIDFGENLKNKIKIETAEEAKPGDEVNIKVTTSPNSFVGLLGVDQSVLLLKQGNDLSKNDVFNEMRSFNSYTHYSRYGSPGNQAGVVTLTNANYTLPPRILNAQPFGGFGGGERPVFGALPQAGIQFSLFSNATNLAKPIEVRKEFPQVWLWSNLSEISPNGEIIIKKKVPDTITSWVITGFSLDEQNGIGLTDDPTKLKVFQPFFVSTNLPYSVKRGEVIGVPVIIFNYMNKTLDVDVTMENNHDEFDFTEATNEVVENKKHDLKRSKRVSVAPESGESLSFMIRPKVVGHITIKLIAVTPLAGDGVQKMLQVDPEGVTEYGNKAVLVDLREAPEQVNEITIEIPENAVVNSTHIEANVVGDLLGPTIKNLDNLVRKPYGCGEQNMVNFVPNILVLEYLESVSKLTPEIEDKAKKFMEIGYQRELTYKHDDGSYSAFGKSDKSGSTWLTAYVARSFRQASKYIAIDENIIKAALEFLAKNQAANGSFPEVGHVIDHEHASDNKGVVLTAFTVLAFLENAEKHPEYKPNVDKALEFIEKNSDASGDIYSLAICAYTMNVAKSPSKDDFIGKLEKRATVDTGRKWWAKPETEEEKKPKGTWYYYKPRSANVEMTAYGLLAYLESGRIKESLPILKWLIAQRNSNGGFESTQDTVVGLSALIKFAKNFGAGDPAMNIDFNYDGQKTAATVDKNNAIVLQSYELPATVRNVTVNAKGKGAALVQVSYRYNVDNTDSSPGFQVEPTVDPASNSDFLKLLVAVSYVPAAGQPKDSNMAVMEVNLPSGFSADLDGLADIEATERVKKVETKNSDTIVVIYFDSLNDVTVTPAIKAYKTHKVAQLKPAAVVVYDYYDDTRRARKFYSPPETSLCEICEGDECGSSCAKKN